MNFFHEVKDSVIDFKFYRKIKDNRFAKSFLYLLLLMLIIYSMLTARNYLLVRNAMEQAAFKLSESMPNFQLKDGKFSFEGKMPYYVSNSASEVIVIDTTGTVNEASLQDAATGILVTADYLYIKNGIQQQALRFAELQTAEFNKQDLLEFLPKVSWLALIFMALWFVFVLVGQLVFAVLLALIGLAISQNLNTGLKFKHMLNFSIYALTLPMLIDLAVDISMVFIPEYIFFIIYTAVALTYLLFAIKTYKESINQPPYNDEGLI